MDICDLLILIVRVILLWRIYLMTAVLLFVALFIDSKTPDFPFKNFIIVALIIIGVIFGFVWQIKASKGRSRMFSDSV